MAAGVMSVWFPPSIIAGSTFDSAYRLQLAWGYGPPAVVPVTASAGFSPALYQITIRNGGTLDLLAEIGRYSHLSYTRAELEAGAFTLVMTLDDWLTYKSDTGSDPFTARNVVEVRRDSGAGFEPEFTGLILRRKYDAMKRMWAFEGQSLLGLLAMARIVPPEGQQYDVQAAGVAGETAMKHYTADHFAARIAGGLFTTASFAVVESQGRGDAATYQGYNGRFQSVLEATVEIGRAAKLLHRVVLNDDYTGYRYEVYVPVDKTVGSEAPVIFSREFMATELRYEQSYAGLVNTIYTLGAGSGASRAALLVSDATSIGLAGRREGYIDARDADTDGKLTSAAQAELAARLAESETVMAQASLTGPWQYRRDYDLGDEVTVALPEIGVQLDRRIAEVHISLEGNDKHEEISIVFGLTRDVLALMLKRISLRSQSVEVA